MASDKSGGTSWLGHLFQTGLYKRNQGRIARQVTFTAAAILVALGCWTLSQYSSGASAEYQYGVPIALLLAGLWICYRVVNIPQFADFLVAVEGEMTKVSWPSRTELFRSSIVVILTILLMAAVLFAYDLIWSGLLKGIGVLD